MMCNQNNKSIIFPGKSVSYFIPFDKDIFQYYSIKKILVQKLKNLTS